MMKTAHLYFLLTFACFLLGCESTPPAPTPVDAPAVVINPESAPTPTEPVSEYIVLMKADLPPRPQPIGEFIEAPSQMLTQSGENFNAAFSSNGKKLLFSSRNRPQHLQAQVYEFNLENKKEKRLTHQDGEVIEGRFLGENKLIYVSTTDEQKEDLNALVKNITKSSSSEIPTIIQENNSNLPTEIYLANNDGSHIQRITDAKGFDGFTSNPANNKDIVYTSYRSGSGELYLYNSLTGKQQKLLPNIGANSEGQHSADGKMLVWVNKNKSENTTRLMIGNSLGGNPLALKIKPGLHQSPSFSPDGRILIFSSNFEDPINSEIYAYDLAAECTRKVTRSLAQDRAPSFSPDGKKVLFTSTRSGQDQIYLMDFQTSQTCLSAQ